MSMCVCTYVCYSLGPNVKIWSGDRLCHEFIRIGFSYRKNVRFPRDLINLNSYGSPVSCDIATGYFWLRDFRKTKMIYNYHFSSYLLSGGFILFMGMHLGSKGILENIWKWLNNFTDVKIINENGGIEERLMFKNISNNFRCNYCLLPNVIFQIDVLSEIAIKLQTISLNLRLRDNFSRSFQIASESDHSRARALTLLHLAK